MIAVDVIKIGYKQDKEGFLVTLRLHPHDDHDPIAKSPIGSQWRTLWAPLDENGNAVESEVVPSRTCPYQPRTPVIVEPGGGGHPPRRAGWNVLQRPGVPKVH